MPVPRCSGKSAMSARGDFAERTNDYDPADRLAIPDDDVILSHTGICKQTLLPSPELHPQKHILLGGTPAPGSHLFLARAGIQPE